MEAWAAACRRHGRRWRIIWRVQLRRRQRPPEGAIARDTRLSLCLTLGVEQSASVQAARRQGRGARITMRTRRGGREQRARAGATRCSRPRGGLSRRLLECVHICP